MSRKVAFRAAAPTTGIPTSIALFTVDTEQAIISLVLKKEEVSEVYGITCGTLTHSRTCATNATGKSSRKRIVVCGGSHSGRQQEHSLLTPLSVLRAKLRLPFRKIPCTANTVFILLALIPRYFTEPCCNEAGHCINIRQKWNKAEVLSVVQTICDMLKVFAEG